MDKYNLQDQQDELLAQRDHIATQLKEHREDALDGFIPFDQDWIKSANYVLSLKNAELNKVKRQLARIAESEHEANRAAKAFTRELNMARAQTEDKLRLVALRRELKLMLEPEVYADLMRRVCDAMGQSNG